MYNNDVEHKMRACDKRYDGKRFRIAANFRAMMRAS